MTMNWIIKTLVFAVTSLASAAPLTAQQTKPNIIWIISEDMGPDLGCWGVNVHTPAIDGLAKQGVRYTRVFGTASVCMPNRTAMITGVTQTTLGAVTMRPPQEFKRPLTGGVKPLPAVMRDLGYFTANIKDKAIGSGGKDDWNFRYDGKSWDTSKLADLKKRQPFYAQFNFKMAHRPFKQDQQHPVDPAKVDLPPYYPDHPVARQSWSDYLESIQHLDRNVRRVLQWLETEQLHDNTIVFFLSDHGEAFLRGKYFLYDCSLNQPLIVRWPKVCHPPAGFKPGTADDRMMASIDITAQTVACGGGKVPEWMHGRAFLAPGAEPRVEIFSAADWYGGSKLKSRSVRTENYRYIRNYNTSLSVNSASTEHRIAKHPMFHLVEILAERNELSPLHRTLLFDNLPEEELYDLTEDPHELKNLAFDPAMVELKEELRGKHEKWIKDSGDLGFEEKHPDHIKFFTRYKAANHRKFKAIREATRADVLRRVGETANHRFISGVYPHLTTYTLREDEPFRGGNECGIGGIVPWSDKLYMINYGAHYPNGSTHSLYVVDEDLNMEIHPLSVGGTPAGRMIHKESEQLLIGPYLIDKAGKVRVITPEAMPSRITAIARHLTDPANLVYYYDMEGMLYEANVKTLEVKKLFHDTVPGEHGKGGYTAQGRLVISNNGQSRGHETPSEWQVDAVRQKGENAGTLAEWDGNQWWIIEQHQFTDVTGPGGIYGAPDDKAPLWAIGWDKRSLRLKLLQDGSWHTYLLPKAAHNNDPAHGWFTEWPRIREITGGRWMMDMHGMFYEFPKTFSRANSAGIAPISSHIRYIPDFCEWNGQLVIASDETSIQGNKMAGQPQCNLWFGDYEDLKEWGPATGYGGPWVMDKIEAGQVSDPFLVHGFDRRVLHLAVGVGPDVVEESTEQVEVALEVDKLGNGQWEDYKTLSVDGYAYEIFPEDFDAQWLRLKVSDACTLTAYLHQTDKTFHPHNAQMFQGLADLDDTNVSRALVYPAKRNRNLRVISDEKHYDFTKGSFEFKQQEEDPRLAKQLEVKSGFSVDDASVVVVSHGRTYRLPKGDPIYDKPSTDGWPRVLREVESERELANIHGTFYEVPLINKNLPGLVQKMRPVASHRKQITDFATWNGLLVLTGVNLDAEADDHVYRSEEGDVALWLGGIDDFWQLGKPIGTGGPWKDTAAVAGTPSDPYLMTGYDEKTVAITADSDVHITLEVDVDHQSGFHKYRTFQIKAGETVTHRFEPGYSAHWVRAVADCDCTATVWFQYE